MFQDHVAGSSHDKNEKRALKRSFLLLVGVEKSLENLFIIGINR